MTEKASSLGSQQTQSASIQSSIQPPPSPQNPSSHSYYVGQQSYIIPPPPPYSSIATSGSHPFIPSTPPPPPYGFPNDPRLSSEVVSHSSSFNPVISHTYKRKAFSSFLLSLLMILKFCYTIDAFCDLWSRLVRSTTQKFASYLIVFAMQASLAAIYVCWMFRPEYVHSNWGLLRMLPWMLLSLILITVYWSSNGGLVFISAMFVILIYYFVGSTYKHRMEQNKNMLRRFFEFLFVPFD